MTTRLHCAGPETSTAEHLSDTPTPPLADEVLPLVSGRSLSQVRQDAEGEIQDDQRHQEHTEEYLHPDHYEITAARSRRSSLNTLRSERSISASAMDCSWISSRNSVTLSSRLRAVR